MWRQNPYPSATGDELKEAQGGSTPIPLSWVSSSRRPRAVPARWDGANEDVLVRNDAHSVLVPIHRLASAGRGRHSGALQRPLARTLICLKHGPHLCLRLRRCLALGRPQAFLARVPPPTLRRPESTRGVRVLATRQWGVAARQGRGGRRTWPDGGGKAGEGAGLDGKDGEGARTGSKCGALGHVRSGCARGDFFIQSSGMSD